MQDLKFVDSMDQTNSSGAWSYLDLADPAKGQEGYPRLLIENRAYCSRVFRKLHIELAHRQDGMQVTSCQRTECMQDKHVAWGPWSDWVGMTYVGVTGWAVCITTQGLHPVADIKEQWPSAGDALCVVSAAGVRHTHTVTGHGGQ